MPDPDGIFADIYVIVFMESSTKQYGADAGPLAKAIDGYSSAANRLLVLVIRDVFEAKEAAATSEVEQCGRARGATGPFPDHPSACLAGAPERAPCPSITRTARP